MRGSLRKIGEYATDVAEIVLNLTVRRPVEEKIAAYTYGKKTIPLPRQNVLRLLSPVPEPHPRFT